MLRGKLPRSTFDVIMQMRMVSNLHISNLCGIIEKIATIRNFCMLLVIQRRQRQTITYKKEAIECIRKFHNY